MYILSAAFRGFCLLCLAGLDAASLSKEELALKVKEYVAGFCVHFSEVGSDPDKRKLHCFESAVVGKTLAGRRGSRGLSSDGARAIQECLIFRPAIAQQSNDDGTSRLTCSRAGGRGWQALVPSGRRSTDGSGGNPMDGRFCLFS
jgi:hypothetical protein